MKAILVWPLCWILYGVGHLASRLVFWMDDDYDDAEEAPWPFRAAFNTYQGTMASSFKLQRWAEAGGAHIDSLPWTPAK